jgi:hypothetical protein
VAAHEIEGPGGPDDEEGIKLRTPGDIQREMARVYRAMRKGRIEVAIGNGLTQTLQYLAKATRETVSDELLLRIAELERRQAKSEEQASAH